MQGLLLSLALHLAAILLLQPAPGKETPRTVVINARLVSPAPEPSKAQPAIEEVKATPEAQPKPAPPRETPPLLTAQTPSPAPPLPIPPPAPSPAPPPKPALAMPATPPPPGPPPAPAPQAGGTNSSGLPSLPVAIDTNWYLARQVDMQPKAIGRIVPIYPDLARRRNQEGSLKLMLKIDDLGRVQSAEVVEASPPGVFDEAALEAFRHARFRPAMKDGRPVRYQAYIRVDFELGD